ncbi:uncharacterized protein BDR25DRAFT_254188 [Lindgomyces ingoldianus]|uniref:Uncharacterized protein n=1 Tax=Lindgomyces ingoldianus TaxID=673940 RepID=A0ACB6R7N4_9PLEO|nr:uncharacterized protein BDR25DRAFT_254188 [Lindgomyces ingoldianus]KAF2475288.1 hypothetical protein BDR25DRAFT_254188 [Lindgomyces ingoldianus]
MSSHTPSPHRFLPPDVHSIQKPKPKPPSALRHGITAKAPKTGGTIPLKPVLSQTPKVTPAKRFVIVPAQHASTAATVERGGEKEKVDKAWTHTQTTPLVRARRRLERVEKIEEGSQESPSRYPNNEDYEDEDEDEELLFTPLNKKRRRLSPEFTPSLCPSKSHIIHQPPQTPAPASAVGTSSHRFLVPTLRPPTISNSIATTPAPTRPHFLLPPQPTSPQLIHPLPETFSPQRKGQKYVPGGLANTLQSWIIEATNNGHAAQTRDTVIWGKEKDDGIKLRLKVSGIRSSNPHTGHDGRSVECFPGTVVFVRGDTEAGLSNSFRVIGSQRQRGDGGSLGGVRVMLAGQGSARSGVVRVGKGNVVGIRAPVWNTDVSGEKWVVGVDWVVLS